MHIVSLFPLGMFGAFLKVDLKIAWIHLEGIQQFPFSFALRVSLAL